MGEGVLITKAEWVLEGPDFLPETLIILPASPLVRVLGGSSLSAPTPHPRFPSEISFSRLWALRRSEWGATVFTPGCLLTYFDSR